MKNRSAAWRQIIIIFMIGLVISTFLGDFDLGGFFGGTDGLELKSLFDTLSMILAIISLVLGTGYIFYRAAKGDEEGIWSEWDDERES